MVITILLEYLTDPKLDAFDPFVQRRLIGGFSCLPVVSARESADHRNRTRKIKSADTLFVYLYRLFRVM